MKILMFDRVPEAVAWAKARINITGQVGDVTAVSLVDDNDNFKAVVVYSAYTNTNIDMHIASLPGSNWLSRSFFNAAFYLPFKILGVPRITGLIRGSNMNAAWFVQRLGFREEGRMRKAFEDGEDLLLYGLLKEEYERHPWSKYEIDRAIVAFGQPDVGGRSPADSGDSGQT